ncbi:hypothetical protein BJ322DRAFT_1113477 [Thelephora terrestris]|uniref:Uncharacterized protein n=1 Tax=Thelephora terrestris TaxID=56493 RepID=A0A9P6H5X4_9AGAM|nr:hypothetical protein BJ322DRAFT_1113477 [Thelephora terrestris]
MPMISDRVFRAENSTATIESADPRSVQNKSYFLPNANVAYPSYREIFAVADKVDARQLEATIARPPHYLTIDDELWYHNLIDHKLQESMRGVTFDTELRMPWETPVASSLWGLLKMGIYDLGNGEGRWPGATRSQHYTAAVGHRLWFLLRTEQKANERLKREVKEAKDDARRMYSEALDTKKTLLLMNDTLRVTFESEMLAMREEHNRLVESLKERDDTIQRDLIEVDRRLNRHRRALNELDTKVDTLDDALPLLGARVESMSERLCHCRTRSVAAVRDESGDESIPDRMASPIASDGSYRTPAHTDGGEEVIRETSEETAVNPVSSSPELEYAGENEVAVPIPPPSISPRTACVPVIPALSARVETLNPPSYSDATMLQCRVDRGELIPVESVDVNGLTDLTLLSVQRAAEAVRLVAQLTERVEGWSVQRTLDQTMVDSARNRLRAEVQLAVAHRLEEARVVEMVDEEVDENASEESEEEVASAEEYWQTRS